MSNCQDFTSTNPSCRTFTIIEPDSTLTNAISTGSHDQSLDEWGSEPITLGNVARLHVDFLTPKASINYRFEYLYIDSLGLPNPGDVHPVVVDQTEFGFTVDFAGVPLDEGYILRWRVVVIDITGINIFDVPESLRLQLPQARSFTATFANPRSTTGYGFSELRVENLVDPADDQRVILAQVVIKTQPTFTVGLNPPPDTDNYFLVARTP